MMKLSDILYGEFEIEPVLTHLLNSTPVQRLKKVHQGGAIFLVDPAINHTRYEHSVGVMYLVKKLGGSMEEQIAALLHDVSHTAFSHVADYIFENINEDYHEGIYQDVIMQSEIPGILKKHGFCYDILFREDYNILEQPLPGLCADRVDYTLRDLFHAGLIGIKDVHHFLTQLVLQDGKMALRSVEAAEWIRDKFTELNNDYFKKPEHVYANIKLAGLLKNALEKGIIKKSDLLKDDFEVLARLKTDPDSNRKLEDIKSMARFKQFAVAGATQRFKRRELHPAIFCCA
ncbi:HD domain-containing protein [Mucilaginibacter celer]|uniref:HD domain-containing protein n=1 Tax=Mucilaginibacter celer TaxID=2305508 RepID=A0A494VMN7_9SPHI|nr:HD domain-containing protein [Mucilaginibacter celer]AYL96597.1 HD domain-containing protein [Mucilaginibacter celer]